MAGAIRRSPGGRGAPTCLVAGDAGKKFKVRVGFTDLDGSAESSDERGVPGVFSLVGQNAAPTGADSTVTVAEDGVVHVRRPRSSGLRTQTATLLASVRIVTLPAAGKGTLALGGTCR